MEELITPPNDEEWLSKELQSYFLKQLKIIMCSNRSKKGYPYLNSLSEEDWKVVRDPVTDKCSKITIARFFDQPTFAFLFARFAIIPDAKEFCLIEFKKKNDEAFTKMMLAEI